jgi:hypothetical protein
MTRGVCWYLVGSIVLVSLAGCGRGFFDTAEREPWRAEAELACLKSGDVKESADVVRIDPITGPGICGAEYPLKVAAFGETSGAYGFADEVLRPPANVGNQPRWPAAPASTSPASYPPASTYPPAQSGRPSYSAAPGAPISLAAPGLSLPEPNDVNLPPQSLPALGPPQAPVAAFGPVAVKPAATLACPIVSALDHWLAESVQPAAQRWFGGRVVEIKQISAYSCRGMNGNPGARISEHAFGNALDIAAFTLADGRRISVKDGWHGMPEEQGFLRDVQAAACQQFNTVLAPGSNAYHHDHIHVDLMRRHSRRIICEPSAVSGQEIAARAQRRNPFAARDFNVTSALGGHNEAAHHRKPNERINEEDEFEEE